MSDKQHREHEIEEEIARIKKSLSRLGRMHPGSISKQKRVRGEQYYQLSYSYGGKGHTKYVKTDDVKAVMREIENYRKFRELTGRWVEMEIEMAMLRRASGRS